MALPPVVRLLLLLSSVAVATVTARLTPPDAASSSSPYSRSLEGVQPKCRPLRLIEWAAILQSETESEFDLTREAAEVASQTMGGSGGGGGGDVAALLLANAQNMWEDNTAFEFDRALRMKKREREREDGSSKPSFPFVVCVDGGGGSGALQRPLSGFRRRRKIRNAIRSAVQRVKATEQAESAESGSAGGVVGDGGVHDRINLRTLYNGEDMLCGYALMDAAVAEVVEFDGCVVQPMLMAMKLMPRTVQLILEKVGECAEEITTQDQQKEEEEGEEENKSKDGQKQEDEPKKEEEEEEEQTVLEMLLGQGKDDEDGGDGNRRAAAEDEATSEDGGGRAADIPRCKAIDELTSPTVDLTLCAGSLTSDVLDALRGDDADAAAAIIGFLMPGDGNANSNTSSVSVGSVTDEVYWTSPDASNLRRSTSSRGDFWIEALDEASNTADKCDEIYRTKLAWSVQPGRDVNDVTVVRVVYDATKSENWEKFCVLSLVAGLAVRPDVCSVELMAEASVSNVEAQWMTQSGVEGERPWFDVGLDGAGQVVALSDTGIDVNNCYFLDANYDRPSEELDTNGHRKIAMYSPYADDADEELGHGTHVAATIAGSRAPDGTYEEPGAANGVAPGAKLAFVDISGGPGQLNPPKDSELLSTGRLSDKEESSPIAHIHSVSWGAKGGGSPYYNNQARNFDNYMFENDDFLAIVAIGNEGRHDKEKSIALIGSAKNILSVGASHSFGQDLLNGQLGSSYIADFSSRGPTADGRMAPDIVAPGKYILSAAARPNQPGACDPLSGELPGAKGNLEGLYSQGGSSMSTPIVAGSAALIRQYFEEGWYGQGTKNSGSPMMPSGALVKAVLMNGAQTNMNGIDNGSKGVTPVKPYDNTMGFGRVSLTNSLYIAGKSDAQVKVWDGEIISDGEDVRTYDITIDTSNGCTMDQLSVTLAWIEEGSPSGCTKCVFNDLDVYITEQGKESIKYFPNGRSVKDSLNNVERIVIDGVIDGDSFTVHVDAFNLESQDQKYALVATGCFGGVANELDTTAKNVFTLDDTKYVEEENNTTMILIIVFSVLGGTLLLCVCFALIRRRREKDKLVA